MGLTNVFKLSETPHLEEFKEIKKFHLQVLLFRRYERFVFCV